MDRVVLVQQPLADICHCREISYRRFLPDSQPSLDLSSQEIVGIANLAQSQRLPGRQGDRGQLVGELLAQAVYGLHLPIAVWQCIGDGNTIDMLHQGKGAADNAAVFTPGQYLRHRHMPPQGAHDFGFPLHSPVGFG